MEAPRFLTLLSLSALIIIVWGLVSFLTSNQDEDTSS